MSSELMPNMILGYIIHSKFVYTEQYCHSHTVVYVVVAERRQAGPCKDSYMSATDLYSEQL